MDRGDRHHKKRKDNYAWVKLGKAMLKVVVIVPSLRRNAKSRFEFFHETGYNIKLPVYVLN